MLLHSAVGSHQHEYSTPVQRRSAMPRRSPLPRSAFSAPTISKPTTYENPSPILRRPLAQLSENVSPTKEVAIVRFREVEQDTMSEDARSVANSESSDATTAGRRKRRRSLRTSTTFHLAHPAPTLTQKQRLLQIRPKLLLQLQQISVDARPKPILDVLPSTSVVPRLMKKFPRMFRGKGDLGINDVMVVKSEEYETNIEDVAEGSESDEEGLGNRELLAVICQMPKDLGGSQGKAEVVLSDGSIWTATPKTNGLFEFTSTDESGTKTTARWVRRNVKMRSVDLTEAGFTSEVRFTFSIINPDSRRHPIMATMNQRKLDIPDYYTSVSPSAGRHPPTSPMPALVPESESLHETEDVPERTTIALGEKLKRIVQVTGIWVALRQGWSPYFKYNDSMTTPLSTGRVRSQSLTPEPRCLSPAATCASTESCQSTLTTVLGGRMRRVSGLGCPGTGHSPLTDGSSIPKRSISTGTAFMQRATARKAGVAPSTVASDSEGESMMGASNSNLPATRLTAASFSKEVSTPPASLALPGSSNTTPDTPTRPQRRTQSVYIPTSNLQSSFTNPQRQSMLVGNEKPNSGVVSTPKIGRWKAFKNLFRKSHSSDSSRNGTCL